ncbi:MAG: aldo/keto reductase [Lachnospiraceae bacterium]|nr:aldo/keto reductase [Lachnospiraceae bacterium]
MGDIFNNAKKLGFGLMRLPLLDENDEGSIDIEQMKKMTDHFLEMGYTYFDTAIMYCGMKSQDAVKEALTSRYPRESYTLATKLHADFFNTLEGRDEIFNDQLERMGVTYFDYYLIHDIGVERYPKYEELDCFRWLQEKKEQGLVRHIGFSSHDSAEFIDRVLTDHPEMEFVQLQINYLDWESEGVQSRKCYEVCEKHGKPVIVMEPVRGGTLAKVPDEVEKMFKEYHPEDSIPSWAIRFAASHDNVKIVLSGMSNMEQMLDNTGYMKDFEPLNDEEMDIVNKASKIIQESVGIPCTGCSYCTEGCPMNIAIPRYFALYNADELEKGQTGWRPQQSYYDRLSLVFGKASECISCGQCEGICPQHLPIMDHLKVVAEHFEK